ncbi:MAG: dihydrodipicolinate synthase family protein [Acidimicrobiia bacterium]
MTDIRTQEWPRALPALVTPFDSAGEIDLDAHAHNVAAVAARGGAGILIAGSTGEGPYLEPGERAALVETARAADPSMFIITGVHAESLRQASAGVAECAHSDAALVVTPTSLVRRNDRAITDFYTELAERCPVPLLLYSVPGVTGYELPVPSVAELAHNPNIVGIKDSGGDPTRLPPLAGAIENGFVVFAGASRALYDSAASGAWGAITASANYALTDVSLAARQDAQAQQRLSAVSSVVEAYGVAGSKAAAQISGLEAGHMRRPLTPVDEEAFAEINDALTAAGLTSSK